MSDVFITAEAIPCLCNVEIPSTLDYSPVVPIIKLKKVKKNHGHGSFQYRLLLSDGNCYCDASLASSLHHLVDDGLLEIYCLVRITNYSVVEVHNTLVVIVIDLDVVQKLQSSPVGTPGRFNGVIDGEQQKQKPSDLSHTQDEFIDDDDVIVCRDCNGRPCDWTRYGSEVVAFVMDRCNAEEDMPLTNRNKRFLSYAAYSAWKHGFLGRNNRVKLPTCVEESFRSIYPTEDGTYVGFWSSSDP